MPEATLYERLGGAFAIAAVIDHFSDAVVRNPITGQGSKDPELDEWSTKDLDRLPGLKFMRTLWVCEITGGPQVYAATKPGKTHLGLEERIGPSRSHRRSSTKSQLSLRDRSSTSKCPSVRRVRFWPHSPRTKKRWSRATRASTEPSR